MSRFIAVMGVGRCGSSAVAGMLHKGGVPMGRDLIGPHERFNARGHFEDHEWHALNRLVAHQCCPFEVQGAIRNETVERYPQFVNRHVYSDSLMQTYADTVKRFEQPVWGMKCIMLGLIWPYVHQHFGDDVRVIVVQRDRDDVIQSRMEHSQLERKKAEKLIDALQGGIDEALRIHPGPVLQLSYTCTLYTPEITAELLSDFVGLESFNVGAAEAHIEPKLDHSAERMAVA